MKKVQQRPTKLEQAQASLNRIDLPNLDGVAGGPSSPWQLRKHESTAL